jgi:hypothetical protein
VHIRPFAILLFCVSIFSATSASASPVAVRHKEGSVHGFLLLSSLDGVRLAEGDLSQVPKGNQIVTRITYHFKDGSLQDETTVFSQRGTFRLISYHLVQKGPAFKQPSELSVAASTGEVTVHYTDEDKEKTITDRIKLPPDLANGLVPILLKNLAEDSAPLEVSMLVATPKPRIVKLVIKDEGKDRFSLAGFGREAMNYTIKIDIGGLAGLVAPLVGKQPPDSHVWILGGDAPAFVKSESQSYMGGPIWRTELLAPTWPQANDQDAAQRASWSLAGAGRASEPGLSEAEGFAPRR